jgi:Tol biopolymer transport system component
VDSGGVEGNGDSYRSSISADGRYVAFGSEATNLVPGDTNGVGDVFVRDRQLGTTVRVSVDSLGAQGNGESGGTWRYESLSISADGRFVAFHSYAWNFDPFDFNGSPDVFVHDRQSGTTERVSLNSAGAEGNRGSYQPSISGDGRYVAFESASSNLAPGDTNGVGDIFVHDRQTGATKRVSVDSAGVEANDWSLDSCISADGRFVAFYTEASNLVVGDTNNAQDLFVHDCQTATTERVSVDSAGTQGDGNSFWPSLSADGRYVAFLSAASNLVPGDTNGHWDVMVRDRMSGTTERVSMSSLGEEGNLTSYWPSMNADGRFVAFGSWASNLVSGDTNGVSDMFVFDREAGITLEGTGSCPGTMTFTASGLAAGATVAFIWGTPGSFIIPTGRPCAGTALDLVPLLKPSPGYLLAVADSSGIASVSGNVPASACGKLLMQALDLASCMTSNTTPM